MAPTIVQGVDLLRAARGAAGRALVILSDGEAFDDRAETLAAARSARDAEVEVVTVGFGTEGGATIPLRSGGSVTQKVDARGTGRDHAIRSGTAPRRRRGGGRRVHRRVRIGQGGPHRAGALAPRRQAAGRRGGALAAAAHRVVPAPGRAPPPARFVASPTAAASRVCARCCVSPLRCCSIARVRRHRARASGARSDRPLQGRAVRTGGAAVEGADRSAATSIRPRSTTSAPRCSRRTRSTPRPKCSSARRPCPTPRCASARCTTSASPS